MKDMDKAGRQPRNARELVRHPLFRLLAINLLGGIVIAALTVVGLLALNPMHLRDLILGDRSPGVVIGLLLFGFVVTFASTMMGSAIMALARSEKNNDRPRGQPLCAAASVAVTARGRGAC